MTNYEGIQINITPEKSEELFYNAMCNSFGCLGGYGLRLEIDEEAYKKARKALYEDILLTKVDKVICVEDVYLRMLKDGGYMIVVDEESGDYTVKITIKEVHERVSKTPLRFLMNMINDRDDASDGDALLQTVFFEDVIFG